MDAETRRLEALKLAVAMLPKTAEGLISMAEVIEAHLAEAAPKVAPPLPPTSAAPQVIPGTQGFVFSTGVVY